MEQRQAVTWWTWSHPPEAKDDPEKSAGSGAGLVRALRLSANCRLCQVEQDPAVATRVAWERDFCSSTLEIALLFRTLVLCVLS